MKLAPSTALLPAVAFALLLSPPAPRPAEPGATTTFEVPIGRRQLFLDDAGIERLDAVERGCQVYGTAYRDEGARRFKLWYLTGPRVRGLEPLKGDLLHGVVKWEKGTIAAARGRNVRQRFTLRSHRLYSYPVE